MRATGTRSPGFPTWRTVEVYGLHAGGHHWTSVLIHTASALLLFFVLSCMTHSLWASALVAALFAIHPLHVESVAWVSERKDVLSGFFWILTMGAYAHYVKHPTIRRYLLVLVSFVMGLLSKPMVVTLPFVLLLLDYWPLRRFTETKTAFDRWCSRDRTSGSHALPCGCSLKSCRSRSHGCRFMRRDAGRSKRSRRRMVHR